MHLSSRKKLVSGALGLVLVAGLGVFIWAEKTGIIVSRAVDTASYSQTLSGVVYDTDGKPLSGVTVTNLSDITSNKNVTATSGSSGSYTLPLNSFHDTRQGLVKAVKFEKKGTVYNPGMTDVPTSNWAYAEIGALKNSGIVSGFSDGTFRPTQTTTRAEMAVFIAKALIGAQNSSPNLLLSGSFEEGGNVIANWSYNTGAAQNYLKPATDKVEDGSRAIKYTGAAGGPYMLLQNQSVLPNTLYTVSGYIYVPTGSVGSAFVDVVNSTGQTIYCRAPATVKDQWGWVSCSFTSGATGGVLSVRVGGKEAGPAWFDNIRFVKGADTEPAPGPGPAKPSFSDVPMSNAAYKYIEYLKGLGVISGYPDGSFHPDETITRAQLAVYLANALKLTAFTPAAPSFTDVPKTYWAYSQIEAIKLRGIMLGCLPSDATNCQAPVGASYAKFYPEQKITREQMAYYLAHAFNIALSADGFNPQYFQVVLSANTNRSIKVILAKSGSTGSASGRALNTAGAPIANAKVIFSLRPTYPQDYSATTDSNGNFFITGLPAVILPYHYYILKPNSSSQYANTANSVTILANKTNVISVPKLP